MTIIVSSKAQMGVEIIWVVIVILIIAIGVIAAYPAFKEFNDDLQADADFSAEAKQASETTVGNYPSNMDTVIIWLFLFLWGFLLIAAYFANSAPVWMFVSIILMIIGLVVIMLLANTYEEFINDDGISSFSAEFPKVNWLMEHILLVMIFVCMSTFLVMYGRSGS